MYIMMCELYRHSNPKDLEKDTRTLITAHPIDAVETREEANAWMFREPAIIVNHLNLVTEDEWELGMDRNESHAQIWNTEHTLERMYVARYIS